MATEDEIRTWCYKLGNGRLEQSGVEVKVEVKSQPAGFSGFRIHLYTNSRKEEAFDLLLQDADHCIEQGNCDKWKRQLDNAIDAIAPSGVGHPLRHNITPPPAFGTDE